MMIKKIISKTFIFIVSSIMFSIIGLLFYFMFSNVFFTLKNWNIIEKGIIVNIWIYTNNSESYHAQMYDVRINNTIFKAKEEMDANYTIGDTVLVQPKGNNNARILYVNGKKVGNKINGTEYISLFFLILFVSIVIIIINNKVKK